MSVLVFGGNGFVGCKVMERLAELQIPTSSVSRQGKKPRHLENEAWADSVQWLQGDASEPDPLLFEQCTAVVTLVGSPPVPTFSQKAYDRQVFANGQTNVAVIESAAQAGVKTLVLQSADIPAMLRRKSFGYYVGKQMAYEAAQTFVQQDTLRRVSVLRPSGIYGTRHSKSGRAISLSPVLYPVHLTLNSMPNGLKNYLPSAPVSVEQVAGVIVTESLKTDPNYTGLREWTNQQIINWSGDGITT
jgi:nucleoside-diphosphate-sugar epimerase